MSRLGAVACGVLGSLLVATLGAAADGELDPLFGADGLGRTIVWFDEGGANADVATALHVDPATGAIYLAGTVDDASATSEPFGVAKLTPDGYHDSIFGLLGGGRMTGSAAGVELGPREIHLGPSGGPRLTGGTDPLAGGNDGLFGADVGSTGVGYSVSTFELPLPGGGSGVALVQDATLDAAGRRLVCGHVSHGAHDTAFIARVIDTGGLDPTFALGGQGWVGIAILDQPQGATWCEAIEVDRAGRILLLLRALNFSTLEAFGQVVRMDANGIFPDAGFGDSGQVLLNVRPDAEAEILTDLAISDYGDILVVGYAQGPVASSRSAIFRLLSPDGQSVTPHEFYVVPTPPQTYTRFELERAAFDPAGRLLAAGTFVEGTAPVRHRMAIVRFSAPFTFDASFGTGGFRYVGFTGIPGFTRERADLEEMQVAPDGRILLAGRALYGTSGDNYDFAIARLTSAAIFLDGFERGDRSRWSSGAP